MSEDTSSGPLARLGGMLAHYRTSPVYLAALLGAFAFVGAALLAIGHAATKEAIRQRLKEDLQASLAMVAPPALHDNDLIGESFDFKDATGQMRRIYPIAKDGVRNGAAFQVTGSGYSGTILILMAVDHESRVLGVRVLQHAETPGLGDKIEADKDDWVLGFNTRSLADPPAERWKVKKDGGYFDQFSGATITPRAVVKAVHEGLEFFEANKARLLAPTGISQDAKAGISLAEAK